MDVIVSKGATVRGELCESCEASETELVGCTVHGRAIPDLTRVERRTVVLSAHVESRPLLAIEAHADVDVFGKSRQQRHDAVHVRIR